MNDQLYNTTAGCPTVLPGPLSDPVAPLSVSIGVPSAELDVDALARRLAEQLGRERAHAGAQTTEFRVTVLLALVGVAMIVAGVWGSQPDLVSQGRELVQWVGAGYAISRGLSKVKVGA